MANLQGHNEPVAWKCANCGNTSDCQGVGQGDNWCNSCAVCGQMQPLYAAPPAAPDHLRDVAEKVAPDGWVMVPREPTQEMCAAAVVFANGNAVYKNVLAEVLKIEESIYAEIYEAMIAAAPAQPVPLTQDQIADCTRTAHRACDAKGPMTRWSTEFARAIEAALGITGGSHAK